ncbi:antitoxin [Kitasatospora sp. NBC_01246]
MARRADQGRHAEGHEDQSAKSIDKAGDLVDPETGATYEAETDAAQDKLKAELDDDADTDTPPKG